MSVADQVLGSFWLLSSADRAPASIEINVCPHVRYFVDETAVLEILAAQAGTAHTASAQFVRHSAELNPRVIPFRLVGNVGTELAPINNYVDVDLEDYQ